MTKNCSYGSSKLDIIEMMLEYTHINPCCPFSLKSEMTPKDQLMMESMPHLVISAQREEFEQRIYEKGDKKTTIVGIPKQTTVLANLNELSFD